MNNSNLEEEVKKSKLKSMLFYDIEYEKQRKLYLRIKLTFDLYRQTKISVHELLKHIKVSYEEFPDKVEQIFQSLGLWATPEIATLIELKSFFETHSITTIIDYGAGIGLWSSMIDNYMANKNLKVIAYDLLQPHENKHCNYQLAYKQITNQIDLKQFDKTSVLMIIHPPKNSMMFINAIKSFSGNYLLLYEQPNSTDLLDYLTEQKDWKYVKMIDKIQLYQKN